MIVTLFLPINTHYIVVLRSFRILRVPRLFNAVPRLQILICALLKSLPSMGYVSLLLSLLFYIYGVGATYIFANNYPVHFGSLPLSILSLFRVVTIENWTDIIYINMYGCDSYGYEGIESLCTEPSASPLISAFFFVSFVLFGSMIVINLFIGVMTNSVE
ncbi:MAG: ion transporter [Moorea sp. SIO2B7]|nr:ion transporter [Moorena sp. SIO2B7]